MTERLHFHFLLSCIGEGNGTPLQCSCLENPRPGGAQWAAIYGVAQSWTQLKRLSISISILGFSVAQWKRISCRFDPWVRKMPWRREWQSTSVFLPGESQGQKSLMGYSPQITKSWTGLEQLSVANMKYVFMEERKGVQQILGWQLKAFATMAFSPSFRNHTETKQNKNRKTLRSYANLTFNPESCENLSNIIRA